MRSGMRNHEPEKRVSANEPRPARYRVLQIGGAFAIISRAISTAVPALLAQLAEQLTLNQRVEGSSPSGGIWYQRTYGQSCLAVRGWSEILIRVSRRRLSSSSGGLQRTVRATRPSGISRAPCLQAAPTRPTRALVGPFDCLKINLRSPPCPHRQPRADRQG
jgi:hypothetical protein